MRRWMAVCLIVAGSFALAHVAMAQDAPKPEGGGAPVHYYHLQFVIQELNAEGKVNNSRSYTATVSTARDETASVRVSSRVPVITGSYQSDEKNALVNTQYQYIDLGTNIDTSHAQEVDHRLSLNVTADVSSMATIDPRLHAPVIRENKWRSVVLIPIGKATTIFTSDSLDSTGSMRMVVTVTPIE
jgi:type II secretory pathway component GspD/PulD (secretin)